MKKNITQQNTLRQCGRLAKWCKYLSVLMIFLAVVMFLELVCLISLLIASVENNNLRILVLVITIIFFVALIVNGTIFVLFNVKFHRLMEELGDTEEETENEKE